MTADGLHGMLDTICPMYLVLDKDGLIVRVGPTLQKVFAPRTIVGGAMFSLFEVKRPQFVDNMQDLTLSVGKKLRLRFREAPHLELKGVIVGGMPDGQYLMTLSFGINVVQAVQAYGLTASDFAVTDLAVEMLYLVEAKSAAMDASKQLNERLQMARDHAEQQALTDALTGLSNRRAMEALLQRLLGSKVPFAVMHLDLDHFKTINDTLGHAAGDFVLVNVADILRKETREDDLVARIGGDEFVLILQRMTDRKIVSQIAQRIIDRLRQPMEYQGEICHVSASVGTTVSIDYTTPDADVMIMDADVALYAAKAEGRNRHRFYTPALRTEKSDETTSRLARKTALNVAVKG